MDFPGTGTTSDDSEMSAGTSAAKGEAAMRSAGRFVALVPRVGAALRGAMNNEKL